MDHGPPYVSDCNKTNNYFVDAIPKLNSNIQLIQFYISLKDTVTAKFNFRSVSEEDVFSIILNLLFPDIWKSEGNAITQG